MFVQAQIKENIEALRHWYLWGKPPVTSGFPSQRASQQPRLKMFSFDDVIRLCMIKNDLHIFYPSPFVLFSQGSRKVTLGLYEKTEAQEFHVLSEVFADIGCGNGLLSDVSKPLPELILTCLPHRPGTSICYFETLKISLTKMCLDIKHSKGTGASPRSQWVNQ